MKMETRVQPIKRQNSSAPYATSNFIVQMKSCQFCRQAVKVIVYSPQHLPIQKWQINQFMCNLNLNFEHNLKQNKNNKIRMRKKRWTSFPATCLLLMQLQNLGSSYSLRASVASFRWWKCKETYHYKINKLANKY